MIRLDNWRVRMEVRDRELGYESDHLHRRLEIAADLDAGWAVKLDMALGKAKNVVDLERTGDVLWVTSRGISWPPTGCTAVSSGASKGIRWPTATSLSCW